MGFPQHALLGVLARLAGVNFNPFGDYKGGVKADAELPYQLRILFLIAGEMLQKCRCAGFRNRAKVVDHLFPVHTDAIVADGDRTGLLVDVHVDLQFGLTFQQAVIR